MIKLIKKSSDILAYESSLKQKEDLINDLERYASYFRGKDYYKDQSYLLFQAKSGSFSRSAGNINSWRSTGIHNENNFLLSAVNNASGNPPRLLNQNPRLGVTFIGNLLKQGKIAYYHSFVIHIYIIHKLQKRSNDNPDMTI